MIGRNCAFGVCAIALLVALAPASLGALVSLQDVSEATGNDANNDGIWDTLYPGPSIDILAYNGVLPNSFNYNERAAVEFDLSAIPANATVDAATLFMSYQGGAGGTATLQFNGFAGTGTVRLQDFQLQNPLGPRYGSLGPGDGTYVYKVPVTAFLQSLLDAGNRYAGFMAENVTANQTSLGGTYSLSPPALQISYTTVPEPSGLALFALVGLLRRVRSRRCRRIRARSGFWPGDLPLSRACDGS